jgi:hypothetical protein
VKSKTLVNIVLLGFIAVSVVVLAAKQFRRDASTAPAAAEAAVPKGDTVIAYYFHGKTRCPTCQSIEAYAHEAVDGGFADQLKAGTLQWQVVNFDEPANEHFQKDYELAAPSVVLVRFQGGKQADWRNLPEVWELVGDKKAFVEFVTKSVREFLAGPAKGEK